MWIAMIWVASGERILTVSNEYMNLATGSIEITMIFFYYSNDVVHEMTQLKLFSLIQKRPWDTNTAPPTKAQWKFWQILALAPVVAFGLDMVRSP